MKTAAGPPPKMVATAVFCVARVLVAAGAAWHPASLVHVSIGVSFGGVVSAAGFEVA
jgi:hypothetical protein